MAVDVREDVQLRMGMISLALSEKVGAGYSRVARYSPLKSTFRPPSIVQTQNHHLNI